MLARLKDGALLAFSYTTQWNLLENQQPHRNPVIFLKNKSDQIFLFSYLFFTFVQNFKSKKKEVCILMFSMTLLLLKELYEFCV